MLRKLLLNLLLVTGVAVIAGSPAHATGVQLFSNNAVTTLDAPASTTATTITVTSSAAFPTPVSGDWFIATFEHLVSGVVVAEEIIKVTNVAGGSWTVVRAQEGTTGLAWVSGDTVALLPTAGGLGQFTQPPQVQADTYNYVHDVGSANTYTVGLVPGLAAHVEGLPIRFLATHANTGAATFNDGTGSAPLVLPNGSALSGGEIAVDGIYTAVYSSTAVFQLIGTNGNNMLLNPLANAQQAVSGPVQVYQNVTASSPTGGTLEMVNTSAGANNTIWAWQNTTSSVSLNAYTDNTLSAHSAFSATRTGDVVDVVTLGGSAQVGSTQATGDTSTDLATDAFVANTLAASPVLGGVPTAPTAAPGNSTTQVATTAFVQTAANQSVGSTNVGYQATGVSGIGTGYTSIIADVGLVPGVYAVLFDGDVTGSGSPGSFATRVLITAGTDIGTAVTTIGNGYNSMLNSSSGTPNVYFANAAGMTGAPVFNSTQHMLLRGTFTLPAGDTSVTFEFATSSGNLAVSAGSYVEFTRIN